MQKNQMTPPFFLSILTGFFLLGCFWWVFPLQGLQTKELLDNPAGCPYYITVQSILANYPLLASDQANVRLIQQKLAKFEKDIAKPTNRFAAIAMEYKNNYYKILNHFGLKTINAATTTDQIIIAARSLYPTVDGYYLDNKIFCVNPLYQWNTAHTLRKNPHINQRRILQYNLASLYDQIPNRYMRILGASQDEFQLGVFSGFFVNNQTTSLNIQLMTGMPMLTGLYVLPGNQFDHMGSYQAIVPWNSFYSAYFTDPIKRKIMNIAGIDVFTVETSDPDWQKIPSVKLVPASLNKAFPIAEELHTYINTESYGMAYLANKITYESSRVIKKYEKIIKRNFAHNGLDTDKFIHVTNILYGKLAALKEKHDIILELPPSQMPSPTSNDLPAGNTEIKGIVGERAMFTMNCQRESCTFVFNSAQTPGWHAFVNNKLTSIKRANLAFMAVDIPKGHATVWFIYQSWASLVSYLLSILCLIWIFLSTSRVSVKCS